MGDLVAFAGACPLFDPTAGAAGESIRRSRPELTLVDRSLPADVVRSCVDAAGEVGTRVIFTSTTAGDAELAAQAAAVPCFYFSLPKGPSDLRRVIERALRSRRNAPITVTRADLGAMSSIHPSLCAAIAGVGRARTLARRAAAARQDSTLVIALREQVLTDTKRSRAALKAAVADMARQLRQSEVPEQDAVRDVGSAITDCALMMGAEAAIEPLLKDTEAWVRREYQVA